MKRSFGLLSSFSVAKLTPVLLAAIGLLSWAGALRAQVRTPEYARRVDVAVAWLSTNTERQEKVMIPMRDGVRLSALILFPKGRPRTNLPTILYRSPYLLDPNETARFAEINRSFIENGYAVVFQNVRGRYFSEGTYTYLVGSGDDGYDTVEWITTQSWSNGKVGTLGCSSTAEEQHKLNARQHPGLAATVPISSGAGIGKVGPYNEMGNFYRGGAIQGWQFSWFHHYGYTHRPLFPPGLSTEEMIRLGRFWNLEPETIPASDIDKKIWTLPLNKVMEKMDAAPSDMDDFVNRLPNDPKWKQVEYGEEGDSYGAPMLMINSWYDISIGPNVAMYEYQVKHAANANARDNMYMVITPSLHCTQGKLETEDTIVGERSMGDSRFDYVSVIQGWFDRFVKKVPSKPETRPKVVAYMMGANEWRNYDSWPPKAIDYVSYYLDSKGAANSLVGDGKLTFEKPSSEGKDVIVYDPSRPVPSLGGSICCFSAAFQGGAFDQSQIEMRNDVLVYSTEALKQPVEITGPVSVILYLSSDVRDTDLTAKLIDVDPDGKAYNLDESIQRVRWRKGWDKPEFMTPGPVYKVEVGPLVTSNAFGVGHKIRIEISSSNFPRFERNLNTGGHNYDESKGVTARNTIHHSQKYPSRVVLPVLRSTLN